MQQAGQSVPSPASGPIKQQPSPLQQERPVNTTPIQPAQNQATPVQKPAGDQEVKKPSGRKHSGVMLITRTQLFIYIEGVEKIVTYPFPADVVRDLDVINKDSFAIQIGQLITQNQLPPANFYAILGNNTIFARQILSPDPTQRKTEEEKFLNLVPFDEPSVQHVVMGQNTYAVAANKSVYGSLSEALTPHGFEISLILPEFLFAKEANLSHGLTAENAIKLLRSMPSFKQFNFLKKEVIHEEDNQTGEEQNKMKLQLQGGKSNKKFIIFGSSFMGIGILVLAYLLMQQNTPPVPPPKPPVIAQPGTAEAPAAVAATDGASLASPSAVREGSVQGVSSPIILINHSPASQQQANQLRSKLNQLGFQSVLLQNIPIQNATTKIAFQDTTSQQLRTIILAEVKNLYVPVSTFVTGNGAADIVITLQNR